MAHGKAYAAVMRNPYARIVLAAAVLNCANATARADNYPVNGAWTYEHASEKGPAKVCGQHNVQFNGRLRYDTDNSVREYKNISAQQSGPGLFNIVDEFFTGMIRGNVRYTLRGIDPDHIALDFEKGGRTTLLRRCE